MTTLCNKSLIKWNISQMHKQLINCQFQALKHMQFMHQNRKWDPSNQEKRKLLAYKLNQDHMFGLQNYI